MKQLFEAGVQTHLAGVDMDADVFFRTDTLGDIYGNLPCQSNEAGMVYVINAGLQWFLHQVLPVCVTVFSRQSL